MSIQTLCWQISIKAVIPIHQITLCFELDQNTSNVQLFEIINFSHRKLVICHMSRVLRNPVFCILENKGEDRLCLRYIDSTISLHLNPKFQACVHEISSHDPDDRFSHETDHITEISIEALF